MCTALHRYCSPNRIIFERYSFVSSIGSYVIRIVLKHATWLRSFVNSSPSIISPVCLHCEHLAPPRSNSWLLHTLAVVSYLLNSECHNFHLLNSVCMYTRYGGLYPFLNPGSNDLFLNLDYSPYKHRLCLLTLVSWLPPTFSANLSSPSQPPSSRHPQSSTWEKQLHYLLFFRAVGKIYLYFLCFPPCLLVTLTVDICG